MFGAVCAADASAGVLLKSADFALLPYALKRQIVNTVRCGTMIVGQLPRV